MAHVAMTDAPTDPVLDAGPSDRELVLALRRVASARAHLAQAERAVRSARAEADADRGRGIEAAHTEVLWAQAAVLARPRSRQAKVALEVAQAREAAVLRRHGVGSFTEHLRRRREVPPEQAQLDLARREHEAALDAWLDLQSAMNPTLIIDLTGDEPRIL